MSYLLLIFSVWIMWHPLHLSFTSVEVSKGQAQVMVKLFTDDFEHAVQQTAGYAVNLQDSLFTIPEKRAVVRYIEQHLTFSQREKKLKISYQRMAKNHEAVWLYFALEQLSETHSLSIHNSLMNDIFHDQRNLLIVTRGETEKALRFSRSHTSETIILD